MKFRLYWWESIPFKNLKMPYNQAFYAHWHYNASCVCPEMFLSQRHQRLLMSKWMPFCQFVQCPLNNVASSSNIIIQYYAVYTTNWSHNKITYWRIHCLWFGMKFPCLLLHTHTHTHTFITLESLSRILDSLTERMRSALATRWARHGANLH